MLFQWNSFQNSFQIVFHFCELRSFGIPCFACILEIPSYRNFSIVFEVVLNSMEIQLTEEEYIKTGHLVPEMQLVSFHMPIVTNIRKQARKLLYILIITD